MMPNKNYIKGRRKEYAICNKLKEQGYHIAQRSAGSHSPIDVFAIDWDKKIIRFIQAKPDSMSDNKKKEIEEKNKKLNGAFMCLFEVV